MTFSHLEQSTPEADWQAAGVLELPHLPAGELTPGTVLLLLAHPDDEALGCPGLLAHLGESEASVSVLLCTAGERSHPQSPTHTADRLTAIRLAEFDNALAAVGLAGTTTNLHLGDGELREHRNRIRAEADAAIRAAIGPVTIVVPSHQDGHADHDVLGEVALDLGAEHGATVLEFPIWYWHWAAPEDPRWRSWAFLPDPEGFDRTLVWACYPSQTQPLSDHPGDEAILQPDLLAHFTRGGDTFAVTRFGGSGTGVNNARTAEAVFDQVHTDRLDPWDLRTSDYEIAKRTALIAALPPREFTHILEIGCSVGALSEELGRLGAKVTAVDASERALNAARDWLAEYADTSTEEGTSTDIDFVHATIPHDWPAGRFDCVVLAESGYYLSADQLAETFWKIAASATEGCVLVLCHWRGEIADWPLDADIVHEAALEFWPDAERVHHTVEEYRLDILTLGTGPAADHRGEDRR